MVHFEFILRHLLDSSQGL